MKNKLGLSLIAALTALALMLPTLAQAKSPLQIQKDKIVKLQKKVKKQRETINQLRQENINLVNRPPVVVDRLVEKEVRVEVPVEVTKEVIKEVPMFDTSLIASMDENAAFNLLELIYQRLLPLDDYFWNVSKSSVEDPGGISTDDYTFSRLVDNTPTL